MCAEGAKGERWRVEEGGRKVWRGAGASGFSQTGCFGILSPAWQEYWIWQPYLCICTQRSSHLQTNTALQTSTCPSTPPCTDPAGLPLCGHGSFWTMSIFPPACPFSPFLLLNTSSSSSFLIYVYFISALPSPPLSYPIFTLLLFLLLASKITALLTALVDLYSWQTRPTEGPLLFFTHCFEKITLFWTTGNSENQAIWRKSAWGEVADADKHTHKQGEKSEGQSV